MGSIGLIPGEIGSPTPSCNFRLGLIMFCYLVYRPKCKSRHIEAYSSCKLNSIRDRSDCEVRESSHGAWSAYQ